MQPLELERLADGVHLVDEQLHRPHGRIVRLRRRAAAELVVEDRPPARRCDSLQRLEIPVRRARPAVQAEHRKLAVVLPDADHAVPGLVAAEGDAALDRGHDGEACAASNASASRAASCSAAFLEPPLPTPSCSPSTTATQVKWRSCGGPSAEITA